MRIRHLFLVTALLLCLHEITYARESAENSFTSRQHQFIRRLFMEKRYFDCIGETCRMLSYEKSSGSPNAAFYASLIGASYYCGGQYKSTITAIQKSAPSDGPMRNYDTILLAGAYRQLGMFREAQSRLDLIAYDGQPESTQKNLLFRKIDIHIALHDYEGALLGMREFKKYSSADISVLEEEVAKYRGLGLKSPSCAVALSAVMPGAGQIYAGRISDGIITFLAIAGAGISGYYLDRNGQRPAALTVGFFGLLMYGGNLYGAANAARDHNAGLYRDFNRGIESRIPPYDPADGLDIDRVLR